MVGRHTEVNAYIGNCLYLKVKIVFHTHTSDSIYTSSFVVN